MKYSKELLAAMTRSGVLYHISLMTDKIVVPKGHDVDTAAVGFDMTKNSFVMYINEYFFDALKFEQRVEVLIHEFLHVSLGHLFITMSPEMNIAKDCAINSHLNEIPENSPFAATDENGEVVLDDDGNEIFPEFIIPGKGKLSDVPVGKSTNWYYSYFTDMEKEDFKRLMKNLCAGGHNLHGKGQNEKGEYETIPDAMVDSVKQKIKKAVEEGSKQGWGSISRELQGEIIEAIKTRPIPWENVLRQFSKTLRVGRRMSPKHENKKARGKLPGHGNERLPKLLVMIDESGSVSDEFLGYFSDVLSPLTKRIKIDVAYFDTRVTRIESFKRGRAIIKRKLAGGTCFDAATDFFNKQKGYDGLVILTDGEAPKPKRCTKKRMWLIPKGCKLYFDTTEKVVEVIKS